MPETQSLVEVVTAEPVLVDRERIDTFLKHLTAVDQHPRYADMVAENDRLFGTRLFADDGFWPKDGDMLARFRPYHVVNGVLQVPVFGALLNRFGFQLGGMATGYTYIQRAFERGLADPGVRGIALVVDSPGGEAAGNFELVDKLYANRNVKPMAAFVADTALSGGFSIASTAPKVIVSRSGAVGSVGVVIRHEDISAAMEQRGVKVTFIQAGAYKMDGNRFEPLSDGARARLQARVDKLYGVFVSTIARNRSMSEDAVRETEALVYDAEEAVRIGFADQIGVTDEQLSVFAIEAADAGDEDGPMTKATDSTFTQADIDAAVNAARTESAEGERKRFTDVLASPDYAGREALAQKLLSTTTLSAGDIIGLLQSAAKPESKSETVSAKSPFAAAMDREPNPNIGSEDATETPEMSVADKIFANAGYAPRKQASH